MPVKERDLSRASLAPHASITFLGDDETLLKGPLGRAVKRLDDPGLFALGELAATAFARMFEAGEAAAPLNHLQEEDLTPDGRPPWDAVDLSLMGPAWEARTALAHLHGRVSSGDGRGRNQREPAIHWVVMTMAVIEACMARWHNLKLSLPEIHCAPAGRRDDVVRARDAAARADAAIAALRERREVAEGAAEAELIRQKMARAASMHHSMKGAGFDMNFGA